MTTHHHGIKQRKSSSLHPTHLLLLLLIAAFVDKSEAFQMTTPQHQYPRPLHPGGFSLPPLVEDRLPIVTFPSASGPNNSNGATGKKSVADLQEAKSSEPLRTDILLVKPPDMESLWEWYAYTKRQSDSDPSWGRVWPTALSLARLVLRSINDASEIVVVNEQEQSVKEQELVKQALSALRSASHAVEVGCGLGVAGLAYALSVSTTDDKNQQRTITFLDREPYALHCVMASASTNGIATGPMEPVSTTEVNNDEDSPSVIARAAIDDWTLPTSDENNNQNDSPIKNVCYQDLHCNKENTILMASDILYEPSSMNSLASKLQSLVNPTRGGYALIADPQRERTPGCRDSFVEAVKELGGESCILPLPDVESISNGFVMGTSGLNKNPIMLLESDVDIDGSLAKTVLIVVHFEGSKE